MNKLIRCDIYANIMGDFGFHISIKQLLPWYVFLGVEPKSEDDAVELTSVHIDPSSRSFNSATQPISG